LQAGKNGNINEDSLPRLEKGANFSEAILIAACAFKLEQNFLRV